MKHREYVKGELLRECMVTAVAAGGSQIMQVVFWTGVFWLMTVPCAESWSILEKLIDQDYLGEKDEDQLAEGMYAGLLYGLGDVYSRYYTADEYEQETSSTDGAYVGIGISMEANKEGRRKESSECYEGGPGEIAGLEEG